MVPLWDSKLTGSSDNYFCLELNWIPATNQVNDVEFEDALGLSWSYGLLALRYSLT